MKQSKIGTFFLTAILLFAAATAIAAEDKNADDALARVALFKFNDKTNADKYHWLATSLPEAVSNSLHARFEYADAPTEGVLSPATEKDADALAQQLKGDILIYGEYNVAGNELVMQATVYNAAAKKIIGRVKSTSPLNTRIFGAVDNLASNIVGEIYKFALAEKQQGQPAQSIKVLVLVPSYANALEEQQAIQEMDNLKLELMKTRPAKYLTIYEFFEEKQIPQEERTRVLYFAKRRNRIAIVNWLKTHSVPDAFIVLVNRNRVNITAVAENKAALPVVYAVGATPEIKKAALDAALQKQDAMQTKKPEPKITLTQSMVESSWGEIYFAPLFAKDFLLPAGGIGNSVGLNLHAAFYIAPWLEPHISLTGYYGLQKTTAVKSAFFGSAQAGLGHTFRGSHFSFAPFVTGGVVMGSLTPQPGIVTDSSVQFLLPAAGAGVIAGYALSKRWDVFARVEGLYVIDKSSSLITTVALGMAVRF